MGMWDARSLGEGSVSTYIEVEAEVGQPPVARGLSFDFYKRSCPRAEAIVRSFVQDAVRRDVGLAAGLLRLHFHDCFVQGCDASVLLDGSATGPGEKQAPPNLTLRPAAFKAINDIHDRLNKECGKAGRPVVSCADAARDSVAVSGGPSYRVPLGRRDSPSFATQQDVLAGLPPPTATVPALLGVLSKISLDAADLTCPARGTDRRTPLDVRTPNTFDNKYYVNLVNREGLFTSDQDLFTNPATRPLVQRFAQDQKAFFDQFVSSVVKMGQIKVLTSQGQIRRNCSARNPGTGMSSWSILDDAAESLAF
ncbi:unnamed protein product [Urochloa decumbens]|uniref:Peroxidase n=1 Tax=Urochloa decumbens TaxID=240449 RepID=A0ABC8ZJ91_9POAL